MSKIVPKLNLNKTPQLVDNNSLVFAKNIRLLKDNTIGPDTSLEEVETNTGDSVHHITHHEQISETITSYYYSILDYKNTLRYNRNQALTENPEFNFGYDDPNSFFDERYKYGDKAIYKDVPETETHKIYGYRVLNLTTPQWFAGMFTYDRNSNKLIESGGVVYFIAIREEICNGTTYQQLDAPDYFYLVAPNQWEGMTMYDVFSKGANYVIYNPVYPKKEENTTIIQEAYDEEWDAYDTVQYIAHIVGLNNKIYFFKESNYIKDSSDARAIIYNDYPSELFVGDEPEQGKTETFDVNEDGYITRNGLLFRDSSIAAQLFPNFNDRVKIFEYDEVTNTFSIVKCAWKYSGGKKINGCVSVNGSGEVILTICEYNFEGDKLVPIKHININKCTEQDDESFYTQAPNIPISNLRLSGRYIKNIPAGVYQFFIRYKIHDNFYTNWFPCSKELFAGSRKIIDTLQGSIKHTDLHEDSNNSFVFTIEHLYPQYCANYEQFQLGFILSAEGGVFARSWKHFDMTVTSTVSIYFDYDKTDIEDINIDDLLKASYDVFNVKNVAQYKNRLYIANYIETNFNDSVLYNYANDVKVSFDLWNIKITGHYLNNIPLDEEIDGIYTTFANIPINSIYYDSAYCIIENNISQTSRTNILLEIVPLDGILHNSPYHFPTRIKKITLYDENNNPYVIEEYFNDITEQNAVSTFTNYLGVAVPNEQPDTLINTIIDEIKDLIIGINTNGDFVANINNSEVIIKNFEIQYVSWGEVESNIVGSGGGGTPFTYSTYYSQPVITKTLKTNVSLKTSSFTTNYVYNEYNTFLPFTKYDFYIHYVKQNGVVTNGYYLGTKEITRLCKQYKPIELSEVPQEVIQASIHNLDTITYLSDDDEYWDLSWYTPDKKEYAWLQDGTHNGQYFRLQEITTNDFVITAEFTNIKCPTGYVGCFISYTKYGNNVSQGYNYSHEYDSVGNKTIHRLDCLELNCLLYNTNTNIIIKDSKGNTITDTATYYHSGTTRPLEYLGCSGHVEFITSGESEIDTKCWLIIGSNGKPYNKQLIKLTPFIKLYPDEPIGYAGLNDLNGPGYYCEVITLNREYCIPPDGYYVSGNDIYTRGYDNADLKLELNEDRVEYHYYSYEQYIFSNYNLNYVSLTNDLTPIIRRYNINREGDTNETTVEEGAIQSSEKQLITVVNSLLASYILELKSFFREYTRKIYQEYSTNKVIKFDNTIRVSSIDVDEIYRYIYKFEATDYYNVPTHRGIITNLLSVANTLYSHCEHSLFKFTDNKTLTGQDEEVTLQENDIFNTGISEVFDAQYGYGGLKDREQSLVTFNAYVFYDAIAKIIYAFGGEQQIANIGEPIQKIIDAINPTDVKFVGDEINDRFFVNLTNDDGNVCLSFNFRAKSFIAIHDIDFRFGFHTRRHTYFIHDNYFGNDLIGWSIYRITDKIVINNTNYFNAYQNCYTPSLLSITDMPIPNGINAASACIDVIANIEYEKIKVLNYVNWICSEILGYGADLNFTAEEELNRLYLGDRLRIYSDSSATDLLELTDSNGDAKLANDQRNIDANGNIAPVKESWQYPTYNCGVFTLNYFRDVIKNGNVYTSPNPDLFKYKNAQSIYGNQVVDLTEHSQRQYLTQENALIYGKYFVFRLIFNNRNFKIENVTFRMNDYDKAR